MEGDRVGSIVRDERSTFVVDEILTSGPVSGVSVRYDGRRPLRVVVRIAVIKRNESRRDPL